MDITEKNPLEDLAVTLPEEGGVEVIGVEEVT